MQGKNCFAVTVSLAIIFLSVFFANSIRAVPPQHESMLGSGSSGIQLAQSADPTLEPPQPEKPHPTTGVSGLRPEKPPTMTGPTLYSRGLPPLPRGLGSATERRIALVIGNSAYKVGPLKNPVNDASLIAATLRSVGFKVIERTNADQKAMKRALQKFGDLLEKAGKDGVGLFYYAGHGVQANGRNYLIPVGAEIQRESDLEIEALRANAVLSTMDYARNRLNFVIMDACRNNPYARSFRSTSRGLARMEAPRGTLVAYATGPNEVAMDGKGDNSPYTEALVKAMQEPGVPVEQMFKRVRRLVEEETGSKQTPWEESSLTGDFYFNPAPPEEKTPPVTGGVAGKVPVEEPAVTTAVIAARKEMMFWQSIQNSENPANFEGYLRKYPDGEFTILAKNRLATLELARKRVGKKRKKIIRRKEEEREGRSVRKYTNKLIIGVVGTPREAAGQLASRLAQAKSDALRRAGKIAREALRTPPYSFFEDQIDSIIGGVNIKDVEILENGKVKITYEFHFD